MSRFILACLATALFIAGAWQWSPLQKIDLDQLTRWSEPLANHPAVPLIIIASYVAASFIFFPRPMLTLAFVGIFGPWRTGLYGMAGLLLAAAVAFWFGSTYGATRSQTSHRRGLDVIASKLQRGGIFAVVVIRMLPVAPFTVVNTFVGTLRIRFRNFIIGTAIGLMPGTLTTIVVGDRILAALRHTRWSDVGLVVGLSTAGIITSMLLRRGIR